MTQRVIVALAYAISVAAAMWQASGTPETPEAWGGFIVAVVIAGWGKFSSNTTMVAPNRAAWTEQERKQEALDALNKGLK